VGFEISLDDLLRDEDREVLWKGSQSYEEILQLHEGLKDSNSDPNPIKHCQITTNSINLHRIINQPC
jgi:hypothetical protein